MHKFFLKSISIVLIVGFVMGHSNFAYLLAIHSAGSKSNATNCGCNADVCCCCKQASSHNGDMCGVMNATRNSAGKQTHGAQSSGPGYVSCGGAKKASVIPTLKNNLLNTTMVDIQYSPIATENEFELKALKPVELSTSVYRPPCRLLSN